MKNKLIIVLLAVVCAQLIMSKYVYASVFVSSNNGDVRFSAVKGRSNPGPESIRIWNGNGDVTQWTLRVDESWISVSPSSGRLFVEDPDNPGFIDSELLSVTVDISSLDVGTYQKKIYVDWYKTYTPTYRGTLEIPVYITLFSDPFINSVSPESVNQGGDQPANVILSIVGSNFASDAEISFSSDKIIVNSLVVFDASNINADISIYDAPGGSKNLTVTNGDGGSYTKYGAIKVIDITSPTPNPPLIESAEVISTSRISWFVTKCNDPSLPLTYSSEYEIQELGSETWEFNKNINHRGQVLERNDLEANRHYRVRTKIVDNQWNETSFSEYYYAWTLASQPQFELYPAMTNTTLCVEWSSLNHDLTEFYCEIVESPDINSGWIQGITKYNFTGLNGGREYSVRIKARNGGGVETGWEECPAVTIQDNPIITINSPNGGEYFSGRFIRWSVVGYSDYNIKISYSDNGGESFPYIITESTKNNGEYFWETDNILIKKCRIRIEKIDDPSIADESDGDFTVDSLPLLPNPAEISYCEPVSSTTIRWVAVEPTKDGSFVYKFQYLHESGDFATGAPGSELETNIYEVSGCLPNDCYKARVLITQPTIESTQWSVEVSTYTYAALPDAYLYTYISSSTIVARWGANNNPGYTEYLCVLEGNDIALTGEGGWQYGNACTFRNLEADTEYTCKVKARNRNFIETPWVELGKVKTLSIDDPSPDPDPKPNPDPDPSPDPDPVPVVYAPEIKSISPYYVSRGDLIKVRIEGKHFSTNTIVRIITTENEKIIIKDVNYISNNLIETEIEVSDYAPLGAVTMVLSNDGLSNTVDNALNVKDCTKKRVKVDSNEGKTININSENGQVSLFVAPNTFGEEVTLNVEIIKGVQKLSEGMKHTGILLIVTNDQGLQPKQNVQITIIYDEADIAGFEEKKLVLARYNELNDKWILLSSAANPTSNTVVGYTDHFSTFAIVQPVPVVNLKQVKVYPMPYNPKAQGFITVDNLTNDAEITVYTISGEMVCKLLKPDVQGKSYWTGYNEAGKKVASGIYLMHIKSSAGSKTLKIAIQK
ncbi:MAG: T9SS type A sorting domain-containing protein [bacterium]